MDLMMFRKGLDPKKTYYQHEKERQERQEQQELVPPEKVPGDLDDFSHVIEQTPITDPLRYPDEAQYIVGTGIYQPTDKGMQYIPAPGEGNRAYGESTEEWAERNNINLMSWEDPHAELGLPIITGLYDPDASDSANMTSGYSPKDLASKNKEHTLTNLPHREFADAVETIEAIDKMKELNIYDPNLPVKSGEVYTVTKFNGKKVEGLSLDSAVRLISMESKRYEKRNPGAYFRLTHYATNLIMEVVDDESTNDEFANDESTNDEFANDESVIVTHKVLDENNKETIIGTTEVDVVPKSTTTKKDTN